MKKVVLNYLPPGRIHIPSGALSILKSFLSLNHYSTQIIYWNIVLHSLMTRYKIEVRNDPDLINLIPFLIIVSEENKDLKSKHKIISFLQSRMNVKNLFQNGYYSILYHEIKDRADEIISNQLCKIDFDNVLIVGFTAKFYQWIPGMIIAKKIKDDYPNIKIVIGGFTQKEEALGILEICRYFDFATWGEGEYPLLSLCESLKNNSDAYNKIPRLAFRRNDELKSSDTTVSDYLDFRKYIYPVYDDYFNYVDDGLKRKIRIALPIDGIRGCCWNRCKFCNDNVGYKFRERTPESIVNEMLFMSDKYKIKSFYFTDQDIIGRDIHRLYRLLDLLTQLIEEKNTKFNLACWLIPNELNSETIKRLRIVGFNEIQIGYEALTDRLMEKMDKRGRFAHNILFIKFACKYNLTKNPHVIKGIPDETVEDVIESIANIHFLRFFISRGLQHHYLDFELSCGSKYYELVTRDKKEINYTKPFSPLYFLPNNYLKKVDRFTLYRYVNDNPPNKLLWSRLLSIEEKYKKGKANYKIMDYKGTYYYEEYLGDQLVKSIIFNEPEYWDILEEANDKVCSLDYLYNRLTIKYPDMTTQKIREIIDKLKAAYLLYSSEDYSNVVSVIDVHGADAS